MSWLQILIVDDHEVVRRGLRVLIEPHPGWEVCAEAKDGREAVEKARELKPDVVVMDIGMPELNGLEATRQILKAARRTEVLILTAHESEQLVREVLEAGAHGYVLKSAAGPDLVNAIEALSKHEAFFTSSVARIVLNSYRKKGSPEESSEELPPLLSPREREIIQLLAEGKSNNEVAGILCISAKTVETHRAHIMEKLNLHSIAELVHYAIRNQIVEP
jgi:DNA-binding NarL/FixJ family response regulator